MFRYFESLVDPFPPEPPQQPPTNLYAFCRHYTRGIEPYVIWMAVLTGLLAIGEAMLFGILGQLVDWLANKDPANFIEQEWPVLLGMSLFVLVGMPLVVLLQSMMVHQTLMGNFPMRVRWLAHRYLLNQSYSFFQNEFSGRVATKVMQTALAVRETVLQLLEIMLFVIIYLVTAIALVASSDWRMSLPIIVWLAVYTIILRVFLPRLERISTSQADARSLMTGRVVDSYTNILTLKLFSHTDRESDYIKEGMTEFMGTVYSQMRLVTLLDTLVWSINMMLVFATGALGIMLWMNGSATPGGLAIAMSLAIRLTGMSDWVMWEISDLFENIGTVQDGLNTIAKPHSVEDSNTAKALAVDRGGIEFINVDFTYPSYAKTNQSQVFSNLNLKIAPGEKVGIVGRSGAGKSSLVHLLLRFFDVQSGQILIDGQNIRNVDQQSLRASIAMVTQDTSLLHRSVRENIMFGRPDASEAEMIEAAQQASAHEFIQALIDSHGRRAYDAHVGERGVTLSGGQRQRIAIARVLLKDAPILVLDEATSALDSEVETSIQQSLYRLMKGKTVIAIAHRLSTIAAMDRLIVFDQGQIVESGTHKALLEQNGLYAQLWNHQSGGFLGE